jgi:hypothetical protein
VNITKPFKRQDEKMKYVVSAIFGLAVTVSAQQDTFNYRSTSGKDYGPDDWNQVSCNNLATCVS